jgi:Transcriptional regulatory protein, C terminal
MAVTFGVLGPVVAERQGQPVHLGTVRQRALLAVLALEPRRVVPIDTLVDALWGDDPPARAEVSVRAYVSNLRVLMTGASPNPIGIGLGEDWTSLRARYSGWSEPAWPVSWTSQNVAPAGSLRPAMRP